MEGRDLVRCRQCAEFPRHRPTCDRTGDGKTRAAGRRGRSPAGRSCIQTPGGGVYALATRSRYPSIQCRNRYPEILCHFPRHHTSSQQLFGRRDLARCHTAFTADHSPSLARRVQTGLRPLGKPIRFLMPRPLLVCHGRSGALRQRRQEVAGYRV